MATSGDDLAVNLHHVAKTYGWRVHALRGIRMQVRRGEVFGLLGPNGAGKTTLVKIMMAVVRPTHAQGSVLGRPVGHKPTLAKVGYLPENHRFPPYLTGRQALEYHAALAKVDRPTRRRRAGRLLELVRMDKWAHGKVGTYSKGMQQRIGLAQALMNDPELVVLDEPTDGLDPVGRRETRELLKQLRGQGKTVFLNSHFLGEAELICDRVAILLAGKVVRQGTIDDLTARGRYYQIQLHAEPAAGVGQAVRDALPCEVRPSAPVGTAGSPFAAESVPPPEQGTLPSGERVELDGSLVRIHTDNPAGVQPVIDALRRRELTIHSIQLVRQSLEDFFIQAVADPHNRHAAADPAGRGGRP